MRRSFSPLHILMVILIWTFLTVPTASAQFRRPPPPPKPTNNQQQPQFGPQLTVQMRGPIHEGFAAPYTPDPDLSPAIQGTPPGPIDEAPPPIRPIGRRTEAEWLPGYWFYEEGKAWLWICGTWRVPPPEMQWIPGYWVRTSRGSRWAPGFWIRQNSELVYLPKPPQSRERGPTQPPPGRNHIWIPGNWVYSNGRYFWQDGFWSPAHEDWVWVPACYHWTPRGYLFVEGYWDYPLHRRGLLFAPVDIAQGWRGVYTPSIVLQLDTLLTHLFVRPRYSHYYFGNYYDVAAQEPGWRPWASFAQRNTWADPIAAYYWANDPNVLERAVRQHNFFVNNPNLRPPLRWPEYEQLMINNQQNFPRQDWLALPLNDWAANRRQDVQHVPKERLPDRESIRRYFQQLIGSREQFEFGSREINEPRQAIRGDLRRWLPQRQSSWLDLRGPRGGGSGQQPPPPDRRDGR